GAKARPAGRDTGSGRSTLRRPSRAPQPPRRSRHSGAKLSDDEARRVARAWINRTVEILLARLPDPPRTRYFVASYDQPPPRPTAAPASRSSPRSGRSQAAVAQGPRSRRAQLRRPEAADARPRAPHGLRGSPLPQHR